MGKSKLLASNKNLKKIRTLKKYKVSSYAKRKIINIVRKAVLREVRIYYAKRKQNAQPLLDSLIVEFTSTNNIEIDFLDKRVLTKEKEEKEDKEDKEKKPFEKKKVKEVKPVTKKAKTKVTKKIKSLLATAKEMTEEESVEEPEEEEPEEEEPEEEEPEGEEEDTGFIIPNDLDNPVNKAVGSVIKLVENLVVEDFQKAMGKINFFS